MRKNIDKGKKQKTEEERKKNMSERRERTCQDPTSESVVKSEEKEEKNHAVCAYVCVRACACAVCACCVCVFGCGCERVCEEREVRVCRCGRMCARDLTISNGFVRIGSEDLLGELETRGQKVSGSEKRMGKWGQNVSGSEGKM